MSETPTPIEAVDDAASHVPEPVVTPAEEHHEEEHHEEHHESHDSRPGWVDEIIGAINSLKEASPVTPAEEAVLDETPLKRPWTHRNPFSRG